VIVDTKSATLGLPGSRETVITLNADHSNVCRFAGDDSKFEPIKGILKRLATFPVERNISQALSSQTSEPIKDTSGDKTYEHPSQTTPMYLAVRGDDEGMVELLLNAGITADEPCYGTMPPLCVVGQTGNLNIAKLLINSGADVNAWKEKPLFAAATKGHTELAKLLLASGANPDAPKPNSWTALHNAMATCHPEIAKLLINAGADVNATSITGATPLMIAAERGYTELVIMLLSKGAKTDPMNPEGFTALKIALAKKQEDMARILINAGAKR
jgi:ankyrin repeat protein